MAKRFTDTDKWKKSFFSDLPTEAKLTWIYLLDNCDHTGIWSINLKLLSFQVGFSVTKEKLINWFSSKIHFLEYDKLFIKSFIDFQYGVLSENNNAHKQVIKLLEKIGPIEDLISPSSGAQDKDKDKDMDQDKDLDKDQDQDKEKPQNFKNEIENLYRDHYPRKEGKQVGVKKLSAEIKTADELANLKKAILNYRLLLQEKQTDAKFIKMFSSFATSWKEYLDEDTGKTENFALGRAVRPNSAEKVFDHAKDQLRRIAEGKLCK